jgi:hypothetical protein
MRQLTVPAILLVVSLIQPRVTSSQERGAQQPQQQQPQRGQRRTPVKPPTPMTLRQVLEALSSLRNSSRVEDQISKAGVQFEATPPIVDILKQFGASPKLISMIPVPPPSREPAAPKLAGPLTVVCEPKDCDVVVDQKYEGPTSQNRKSINGLHPGEASVEVFANGYEKVTRRIQLEPDQSKEERFLLKRSTLVRQQSAAASLLKAVTSLGGADGLAELGDIEGSGMMQWTNSAGQVEQWAMTFNKRIGRDLAITFKSKDGQCTASIVAAAVKQECRSGLRNGGDKIAEQGTTLFLSYQPQDVIHALLRRPLMTSESDDNVLESVDTKDSYVFSLANSGLPTELIYRIGGDAAIHVEYSNYLNLDKARYPGRISIGRLNNAPAWVFTLTSVRSKAVRGQ